MDYDLTDGFLTYSDGVHDDFNKNLWTQLGWNPHRSAREIAADYARFFFRPDLADMGADGLFGLENDMRGDLADNVAWADRSQACSSAKSGAERSCRAAARTAGA